MGGGLDGYSWTGGIGLARLIAVLSNSGITGCTSVIPVRRYRERKGKKNFDKVRDTMAAVHERNYPGRVSNLLPPPSRVLPLLPLHVPRNFQTSTSSRFIFFLFRFFFRGVLSRPFSFTEHYLSSVTRSFYYDIRMFYPLCSLWDGLW